MNFKKTIIFFLITLLSGCAFFQKPLPPKYIAWEKDKVQLQQIDSWSMNGVLSITQNKKRDTARFRWEQNKERYTINVSGPLNLNSVRIIGSPDGIELWHTSKKCVRAKTPERLMLEQLGWELPVSNIRYWVLGIPNPHAKTDAMWFDEYGRLVAFEQSGWQVNFTDFQRDSLGFVDLPRVVEMRSQEVFIKIKIKGSSLFT